MGTLSVGLLGFKNLYIFVMYSSYCCYNFAVAVAKDSDNHL